MCSAAPFCLVAEFALEVRPDVVDARQLLLQSVVGRRNDVVLFLKGHQQFLYLERGIAKEGAAGDVGGIEHAAGRAVGGRPGGVGSSGRAVGSAHGYGHGRGAARRIVEQPGSVWGGRVEGLVEELEQGGFRRENLSIDLLEECKVSNELFRQGRNSIGKVRDPGENVDGLLWRGGARQRVGAIEGRSSRRVDSRLAHRLSATRTACAIGRWGLCRLHGGWRLRKRGCAWCARTVAGLRAVGGL